MPDRTRRLPISARLAFALAWRLVAGDAIHSLLVPILLRAPWALTLALLPPFESLENPGPILPIASIALVGDFAILLVTGAMLRFRARSVYNQPPERRPAPPAECYALGFRRIPWLLLTEVVRNLALALAASFTILPTTFLRMDPATFFHDLGRNLILLALAGSLVLPGLFLGFRLAVATESVVLDERDLAGAFQRSFRIMEGRFERWLEMVALSAGLILGVALLATVLSLLAPISDRVQLVVFWMLVISIMPVIQYAWTFFYLRLVEVDAPPIEQRSAHAEGADPPLGSEPSTAADAMRQA